MVCSMILEIFDAMSTIIALELKPNLDLFSSSFFFFLHGFDLFTSFLTHFCLIITADFSYGTMFNLKKSLSWSGIYRHLSRSLHREACKLRKQNDWCKPPDGPLRPFGFFFFPDKSDELNYSSVNLFTRIKK